MEDLPVDKEQLVMAARASLNSAKLSLQSAISLLRILEDQGCLWRAQEALSKLNNIYFERHRSIFDQFSGEKTAS